MKVGYIQTFPIFGEKEQNFEVIKKSLNNLKADLIVLPELFATGYTFTSKEEIFSLAEDSDDITAHFLKKIAKMTGATVVGGFVEKSGKKVYNAAMIATDKDIIDSYRKIHLYYKEKLWFSPGSKPLKIYNVNGVNIGIMICFDWIFPETSRSLALLGADLIAHPANLVLPYCQKAMVIRCLENRLYAVTANRIGQEKRGEDNFQFTGGSQITSYDGKILSSAPSDEIFMDFVDIDIEKARNKKLNEFNDLFKDRRKKFYLI
jgi:predicted amidohydrolase